MILISSALAGFGPPINKRASSTDGALLKFNGTRGDKVNEIPVGSNGQVLTVVGGLWAPAAAGGSSSGVTSLNGLSNVAITLASSPSVTMTTTTPGTITASLPLSGVTAGSYTLSSITVNDKGIVTSASNGSASGITGGGIWFVDGNIGGGSAQLGGSSVSSYSELTSANLTLTSNTSSAAIKISCNSTNASTGANCGANNEATGVVFTNAVCGLFRACFEFTWVSFLNSGVDTRVLASFNVSETGASNDTIIQDGNSHVSHYNEYLPGADASERNFNVCGTFRWTTSKQRQVQLLYEQEVIAGDVTSYIIMDNDATRGQRDTHITIIPEREVACDP